MCCRERTAKTVNCCNYSYFVQLSFYSVFFAITFCGKIKLCKFYWFSCSGPNPTHGQLCVVAKFHYTGPTGPDQTVGDPGLVGSDRVRAAEFSYYIQLYSPECTLTDNIDINNNKQNKDRNILIAQSNSIYATPSSTS